MSLAERMKRYEQTTRQLLPRRTYTLVRIDGRAFHTYLRNAVKPFDQAFMTHMNDVAIRLCEEIPGAQLAYVQSDEVSILFVDFESTTTEPWFGGKVSKIVSVSAGLASAYLAQLRYFEPGLPHFDSRVWTMTDPVEVANYFVHRQQDAVRNSIQMAGQAYFSHKALEGVPVGQIQEMLFSQHGVNWNDYPVGCKRGRLVAKVPEEGWAVRGAPHFKAEPHTELAELIPELPTLRK